MEIKVEKMFCLPDAGSLKAFADICVDDALVICALRVIEGKKGLFVSMPRENGRDGKWHETLKCKTADVFEKISVAVLAEYERAKI